MAVAAAAHGDGDGGDVDDDDVDEGAGNAGDRTKDVAVILVDATAPINKLIGNATTKRR